MATTPLSDLTHLSVSTARMLWEAQLVMTYRMWGMAGLWSVSPNESRRMVAEKQAVAAASTLAAALALASGRPPMQVARAAMAPVTRKTSSNVRRLQKRGARHF